MDDAKFNELTLKMSITPQQVRWPAPEYLHWQRLHVAANEARERVSKAYVQMDEIDRDADLSPMAASAVGRRPTLSPSLRHQRR
jgi:hypothetical protein